jgi:hypothetical protein
VKDLDFVVPHRPLIFQSMESGGILMDSASGNCFELNRLGAEIWRRLEAGESTTQVLAALTTSSTVPPDRIEADLRALLTDLARHELLEPRR